MRKTKKADNGKPKRTKISTKVMVVCAVCGKEHERYPSVIKWQEIRGNHSFYCSRECYATAMKGRYAGENHYQWKGGISRYYKYGYHSREYNNLKSRVLLRDNNTCQYCGKQTTPLEIHHIFSFHNFPEFRFSDDNCLTLCHDCHQTTKQHYSRTRLQIIEKEIAG